MEYLKFTGTYQLNKDQLLHIAQLFLEAEYGDTILYDIPDIVLKNERDRVEVIRPYIQITYVLMNKNEIVGFFIAANKERIKEVSENILGWRKNDPEYISCLNFYTNEALDNDFILHDIAVALKYRGLGFFRILKDNLMELAIADNCKRIIFAVRSSSEAKKIYKHYGAQVIGEIILSNTNYNHRLTKCCFMT